MKNCTLSLSVEKELISHNFNLDKFLENDDFEHVKECIRMTRLGQMLFNDGFNDGFNNGSQKKQLEIARNLIGKLSDTSIAETTGLSLDVILELKKEKTMKL